MTAPHPFTPVRELARYDSPRSTIDPRVDLSWLRRTLPLVLSHKGMFVTAVLAAFTGLVVQVQIPTVIGHAIDRSLLGSRGALGHD